MPKCSESTVCSTFQIPGDPVPKPESQLVLRGRADPFEPPESPESPEPLVTTHRWPKHWRKVAIGPMGMPEGELAVSTIQKQNWFQGEISDASLNIAAVGVAGQELRVE